VLTFTPGAVDSITVENGQASRTAVRDAQGGWALGAAGGWPLDPTLVGTALNSIANLDAFGRAADGQDVSADALLVRLTLDDGSAHTLALSREATGGRAVGVVDDGEPVLLPAAALGLVDPEQGFGIDSWRVTSSVLPGAFDNPQRVRIETGSRTLTLERTGSGWRMTEPVNMAIDDPTEALRSMLGGVEFVGFSPARVLFPPTITVTTPDGVHALGLTDATGPSIATVRLPGVVQNIDVSMSQPPDSFADPSRFMSRRLIAAAPGDVRIMGTASNAYQNTLDGWVNDEGEPLPEPIAQSVQAVLSAMTDGTAAPSILDIQDQTTSFLTLVDRTGEPLGSFRVSMTDAGIRMSSGRAAWTLRDDVVAPWLVVPSDNPSSERETQPERQTAPGGGGELPEK